MFFTKMFFLHFQLQKDSLEELHNIIYVSYKDCPFQIFDWLTKQV